MGAGAGRRRVLGKREKAGEGESKATTETSVHGPHLQVWLKMGRFSVQFSPVQFKIVSTCWRKSYIY